MNKNEISTNNSFGDFLVNSALYDDIEIKKTNINELIDLARGQVKIDCYCPKCKEKRVFSCKSIPYYWTNKDTGVVEKKLLADYLETYQKNQQMRIPRFENDPEPPWTWTHDVFEDTRIMIFKYYCAMENTHHMDYIVLTDEYKMIKIGQYPSVADLSFPELKEFKKVMNKDDEVELKRAIGLFSHGIGVGSFVYLRRIIERIIDTAGKEAIDKNKIDEAEFGNSHIDKRIKMVADYLPEMLVNNTILYGVISKGIHELSEEECLEFFPVMQNIIMMILRQWESKRKDQEEKNNITEALGRITSKIK